MNVTCNHANKNCPAECQHLTSHEPVIDCENVAPCDQTQTHCAYPDKMVICQ